jgi:hypothetical protein
MVVRAQPNLGLESLHSSPKTDPDPAAPAPPLSATLAAPSREHDPLQHQFPLIQRLDSADYELITETLARHRRGGVERSLVERLARAIAAKLAVDSPTEEDAPLFLQNVVEAYRRFRR